MYLVRLGGAAVDSNYLPPRKLVLNDVAPEYYRRNDVAAGYWSCLVPRASLRARA